LEELTLLYQSYNAPLECPVTRTQQRGTEPARSDSFSYNGRNELTAATLGAAPYGYSYDNIGNRKTAREPAEELAYAANGLNQYTDIEESGEAPFVPTYDASGNQTLIKTSTGIWTAVYNAANRAVSFTSRNGNTIIECGYDYQGRRYMKKVTQNGTVASHERYLYRGYLQIAAQDMLDNRNVLRTLLWDPLEPVATRPLALVQGASLYCYGVDFNKNVSEVFDAQGTIAAAYDYSPYGAVTGTGRCTTKNSPWSITTTAITTPKTAGGSTATPLLNRAGGICTGLLIMEWYFLLIISEKKLTNLATQ